MHMYALYLIVWVDTYIYVIMINSPSKSDTYTQQGLFCTDLEKLRVNKLFSECFHRRKINVFVCGLQIAEIHLQYIGYH